MLADPVGLALLVVPATLTPAERLAFVLHDMFAVPFQEIALIIGRSPEATKMLASHGRSRVRNADMPHPDLHRQRAVVDAFLAASRNGDFAALLNVLDPDVTVRSDGFAAPPGAPTRLRGCPCRRRTGSGFLVPGQERPHRARQRRTSDPGGTPRASRLPTDWQQPEHHLARAARDVKSAGPGACGAVEPSSEPNAAGGIQ